MTPRQFDPSACGSARKMIMKQLRAVLLATTLSATGAFALDEYMPIPQGNVTFSLNGGLHASIRGLYDDDGKHHEINDDVSVTRQSLPVQIKYGMTDFLTVEASWPWMRAAVDFDGETESESGFDRPQIALKVGSAERGVAAFVNTMLPLGSEEVVGEKPVFSFVLGGLAHKDFESGAFTAGISYTLSLENEDKFKAGDVFEAIVKPEIKANEQVSILVEGGYAYRGIPSYDGEDLDEFFEPASLWLVAPGFKFQQDPQFSAEVQIPFTVAGRNANSFWGLGLTLSYTIPR